MRKLGAMSKWALAAALTLGPSQGLAQEETRWNFSANATFVNQYLWRGFVANDSPSFQPSASFGYKGFTVTSWSNFSYRTPRGQKWTEHDLTVDYTHVIGKASVSFGYIFYAFPDIPQGAGNHSHEVYAAISYPGFFQPSFTYYRDFDQGDGNYFYFSSGRSWMLRRGVVLNGGLGLGVNNGQWIENTTVSNFDINVSLDIPVGRIVFSPFFSESIGHATLFGSHNIFGVKMTVASVSW